MTKLRTEAAQVSSWCFSLPALRYCKISGPVKITSYGNICKLGIDLDNRFIQGLHLVGTRWHGWLLMSPLQYFSWCSLTPPPPLPPLSFSQKHMFRTGWWRYIRKAIREPLEISSHISLLPSYNSIKLRTGNPAVKKVSLYPPGMESQSLRSDPASLGWHFSTFHPKYESWVCILQTQPV